MVDKYNDRIESLEILDFESVDKIISDVTAEKSGRAVGVTVLSRSIESNLIRTDLQKVQLLNHLKKKGSIQSVRELRELSRAFWPQCNVYDVVEDEFLKEEIRRYIIEHSGRIDTNGEDHFCLCDNYDDCNCDGPYCACECLNDVPCDCEIVTVCGCDNYEPPTCPSD